MRVINSCGKDVTPGRAAYRGKATTTADRQKPWVGRISHLTMPSIARYYIAAHLCLGELGIFCTGYHSRDVPIEGRNPGTLRHDEWDMVLGLGFLEIAFPYCDSPASPQPEGLECKQVRETEGSRRNKGRAMTLPVP
jgi:hypothetical protein